MKRPEITNRRDLARYLQGEMAAARFPWTSMDEEEIPGRTAVKTYLLEAHPPDALAGNDAAFLQGVAERLGASVVETEDDDLVCLRKEDADFWCDTSLGRFWRLHTTTPVKEADRFSDLLTEASPWLDKVWLPPRYLSSLAERLGGTLKVFSLSHNRRSFLPEGTQGLGMDWVSFRLAASEAVKILMQLRQSKIFPQSLSMRSLRLDSGSDRPGGEFCVAEYFHHGKITVTGTSFDEHNRRLVQILRDYSHLVEGIERRFGIGLETGPSGEQQLAGDPIVIEMQWTVSDIEYAIGRMFACADPFRLWGLPEAVSESCYRARAVDLHVGGTLTFDISPDHIVIQLPRGSCGNSVVRFLGSLQYHVNADVADPLPL